MKKYQNYFICKSILYVATIFRVNSKYFLGSGVIPVSLLPQDHQPVFFDDHSEPVRGVWRLSVGGRAYDVAVLRGRPGSEGSCTPEINVMILIGRNWQKYGDFDSFSITFFPNSYQYVLIV
jgi:hypothetical protein